MKTLKSLFLLTCFAATLSAAPQATMMMLGTSNPATPTLMASTQKAGPTSGGPTTTAINTTGSNLIIVGVSYAATHACTFSDSAGNTWTQLNITSTGSQPFTTIYYVYNPTTSTSHTFQCLATSSLAAVSVYAFAGMNPAAGFDKQTGNGFGLLASAQPGSLTPATTNEVGFMVIGFSAANSAVTVNDGFATPQFTALGSSINYGTAASYLIDSATTALNPTWSWTTNAQGNVSYAWFR